MKKVFVSGCYDILHAGHLQFFEEARALGDYLIVSFASAEVLWHHKRRKPSIPDDHKRALLQGLRMIDEVIVTQGHKAGLDFEEDFLRIRPDFLIVTEDDQYGQIKRELCELVGAQYTVLPKTPPRFEPVSTSSIVRWVQAPTEAPLRVDFAGGWLDVPRFARPGEFIVNCAISPLVSLREWPFEKQAGLGGSGAWALLNGRDGVESELDLGVGWQDPAVRLEDFSETAALIAQLDLVIAVDTSVAHLAGALGRPAWVMLPCANDWRWLVGRNDTPWYPQHRLFRQHRRHDWSGVTQDIAAALSAEFSTQ